MATKAKTRPSKAAKTTKNKNGVIAGGKNNLHVKKGVLFVALGLVLAVGIGWFGWSQYQQNGANAASCNTQPFKDVQLNDPFCGEIQWLKDKGVTSGYSDGTFHPSETMSREEMALIAYRYARLTNASLPITPAPCTTSPFTDVPVASAYCGAITWMKSKGITTGYGDNTYRPTSDLNRDAAAAFMYRIARLTDTKLPAKPICTTAPFTDVPVNDMFCGEIQWVKDKGITKGYSDGTYHPVNSISHEAVAAFLYRAAGGTANPGNPAPPTTPDPSDPKPPAPGPGTPGNPGNPNPPTPPTPPASIQKATKVLVIIDENTSPKAVKSAMPTAVSLAKKYGEATNLYALARPSNPNYMALASGEKPEALGLTNAGPSSGKQFTKNSSVFGQAIKNGKTAKLYAEGMTSNCMASDVGRYVVKHNPWPYFANERADCQKFNVPSTAFSADVKNGTLPNVGLLVPDMCNDGHDCKPEKGSTIPDAYLKARMDEIFAGPDWQSGKLIVVFTFDEPSNYDGSTPSSTPVYTFVAHKSLEGKNRVVNTRMSLYSITRLYAEVIGTTPLGYGANAASIRDEFGLPI